MECVGGEAEVHESDCAGSPVSNSIEAAVHGRGNRRILTFDGRSQEVPRNVDVNCESLVECYFRGHI